MQILFLIIPLAFLVLLCRYFYKYILNIASFWKIDTQNKKNKIILAAVAFIVVIGISLIWNSFFILFMHIAVIVSLIELLNFVCNRIEKRKNWSFKTWKKIYMSGIIPIIITIAIFLYGHWNMFHVVETDYTVETDKNIRENGYKVAFISDLHYGLTFGKDEFVKYCEDISNKNVDVVILGGDIVDESTTLEQMKEAFLVLGGIKSNYGTFYIYGNHDASNYAMSPNYTTDELKNAILDNDIKILADNSYTINDEFSIIGRIDASFTSNSSRKSGEELLENVDKNNFLLLVDHQPCEYKENSACGYDLEVSGHTHGGQFFPIKFICDVFNINDMMYGSKKIDNFQAIVSSGIAGWGFPFRTQAKSEYVIINVR